MFPELSLFQPESLFLPAADIHHLSPLRAALCAFSNMVAVLYMLFRQKLHRTQEWRK